MKKIIIAIGIIIFVANILLGFIIAKYQLFNVCVNSAVIIASSSFLLALNKIKTKDGFAISLSFIFLVVGLVEFILGCIAPNKIENNWYLFVVIVLLAFEGIMLVVTKQISNNQNK